MTSEEIHHAASTTCTDAGGRNAPVVYGPWNSTDHACWMKAGNLGNGSSQLVYQYTHCSLPVAPSHVHLLSTAAQLVVMVLLLDPSNQSMLRRRTHTIHRRQRVYATRAPSPASIRRTAK